MLEEARARHRLQEAEEEEEEELSGGEEEEELSGGEEDTWVLPLVQMKPLGIRVDEQVTQVSSLGPAPQTRPRPPRHAAAGTRWRLVEIRIEVVSTRQKSVLI